MSNHPFLSNNTNIIDETFYTATPTYVNGQNVFVSQEKQRKIFDTLKTSIVGLTQDTNCPPLSQFVHGNFVRAVKQFHPAGIFFTFPPPMFHTNAQPAAPPPMWQYNPVPYNHNPAGLRNDVSLPSAPPLQSSTPFIFGKISDLRSPECQEQLSHNPFHLQTQSSMYKLKFHTDKRTSCSDLLHRNQPVLNTQGIANFNNLPGVAYHQGHISQCPLECLNRLFENLNGSSNFGCNTASNVRHLQINTPSVPPQQHVADILDETKPCSEENKKVTFCNQNQAGKSEKSGQTLPAKPDEPASTSKKSTEEKNKDGKAKTFKKFFKKKCKKNDDKYSSDISDDEPPKGKRNKGKKKIVKAKKPETEHETSDTSDSDTFCRC